MKPHKWAKEIKALNELHKHQKCIESEIMANKIHSEKTYWLKVDTWKLEGIRNE